MNKCLAIVLAGGGARGALQVGALRALFEAGIKPDLLVGTSIGAVNAAALALWGSDLAGVERLEQAWHVAAQTYGVYPRFAQQLLRHFSGQLNSVTTRHIARFFESNGVTPEMRFEQISGVRVALVGTDLVSKQVAIYGDPDPSQPVMVGLLASTALPPWFTPVENDGHCIIDGGFLSNLPIEPALTLGATEIIAIDLEVVDTEDTPSRKRIESTNQLIYELSDVINRRHISMEIALAEARGVPVHLIELVSPPTTSIWDFTNYQQLIQSGYEVTKQQIPDLTSTRRTGHFPKADFTRFHLGNRSDERSLLVQLSDLVESFKQVRLQQERMEE